MRELPPDGQFDCPPPKEMAAASYFHDGQTDCPKETTAASYLQGAQTLQEIPAPCKPDFFEASRTEEQPPGAERATGGMPCTDRFDLLLEQVKLQYKRDMLKIREELEKELRSTHVPMKPVNVVPSEGLGEVRRPPLNVENNFTGRQTSPFSSALDAEQSFPCMASSKTQMQGDIAKKVSRAPKLTSRRSMVINFFMSQDQQELGEHRLMRLAKRVVYSTVFDSICATAITVNSILLGVSTDISATDSNPDSLPPFFLYMDYLFSVWFLFELSLRLIAEGFLHFFMGRNWGWNLFDFLVVSVDVVETSATFISGDGSTLQNLTAFRMLRVLRIVRALRVIKLVHFFKELRMMVYSILRSGLSLLWSMMLLIITIFIFSIYLVQNVTTYLFYDMEVENEATDKLKKHFGSLRMAGYVLFQSISGGVSWGEVSEPLMEVHWSNALVFCFFIFFTIFTLLNIVTGIFVDSALNSVQSDSDEMIQQVIHSENSSVVQLQKFFYSADVDRSGSITLDELEQHVLDHRVRTSLSALGVEVHDAKGLFHLLDVDKSGEVSIEEFIFGCLKMKGLARSIDVVSLIHSNRCLKTNLHKFFTYAKAQFTDQRAFQERMESMFGKQQVLLLS